MGSQTPTTRRLAAQRMVEFVGRQEVPDEPTGLVRGETIARYTVLEAIGSGGLGDVYRVYDPKLDRCVALKLIRAGTQDLDAAKRRLEREARALAALDHANVVTVFDFGLDGERLFVAMECIEGRTLRQWLHDGDRTWQEIRDAFVEAGNGLAAAHRAGLVHRDVKPENILVDSADDRIRVVDFGLARASLATDLGPDSLSPSSPSIAQDFTPSGTILGTPRYMPLEQLRGEPTDARSDQFAFCVALFWALYGEWPFAGEGLRGQADAIATQKLPRVGNPLGVPSWLRRAVVRGLAADRDERHATMEALLHALLRDQRSRRRRWWSIAASATAGAALAALAILGPAELTDAEAAQLDSIAAEARRAASDGRFVYPDPALDQNSALQAIIALERSSLPTSEARASELRTEFATRLIALGDEVASLPGGAAFASDYYAAALVFEPSRTDARRGTRLTPGEVASLRDQAEQGAFSPAQLEAGTLLADLAVEGESPRSERVRRALSRPNAAAARSAQRDEVHRTQGPEPNTATETALAADVVQPNAPRPEPQRRASPGPRPAPPAPPTTTAVDEAKLRDAMAAGRHALDRANFAKAEMHFHRALEAAPGSAAALAGLAEAHFERYEYGEAKKLARRAVAAAPKNARFRLLLGDTHYKLTDYRAARDAWEEASRLGSDKAHRRLDKLATKLGDIASSK